MCGIVGYVGERDAAPILMEGLRRMEYRGYDSAGIAVLNGSISIRKAAGKLGVLADSMRGDLPHGAIGIGHTRWATHGAPTTLNAHPHTDQSGRIVLIHNGIIENAPAIKKALLARGHTFTSETDTEVLAHLVGEFYEGNLEDAVVLALRDVEGAYGICVVSADEPDLLIAARNGSPIVLGVGDGEYLVASDQAAIVEHTRRVIYLDNGEMAVLTKGGHRVRTLSKREVDKPINEIEWDLETIERGGFEHFMLKEIFEQPESVENTMRGHLLPEIGSTRLCGLNLDDTTVRSIDRIVITACGTSWHSGLLGKYLIEELARIPTEVEYASEFRYRNPIVSPNTLTIAISQSGETADTLAALQEAKRRGVRTAGLVNVVGSTISREVDGGLYLRCGPEIGVASTKAFTSQVVALAMVAIRFARAKGMPLLDGQKYVAALARLPNQIREILSRADEIKAMAERFSRSQNALYLGRGVSFPVALEGALKLKEISYVHAEGYPAAEMKHGPIALIDDEMPVVVVAPRDAVYGKVVSNVQEVRARGGRVIAIVNPDEAEITSLAETSFVVPETLDLLSPILTVVPLQLFSYYVALQRGCNVDQPRNLAKSVTVE